ncbi:MAG TPA: GntR family transcriptional regulator [Hyphomicrobiales bacterium]|nr:GntR family transcriptional regulator [Hyphomicrobiales bacterium]
MAMRHKKPPLRASKAGFVYESLKTAILTGELPPGTPLDKVALTEKFGASRQPISNAIDRLAFDGLVDVIPQHGSFVSKLRARQISERFFIRRAIESEFAAMAATSATDDLLRRLDLNLRYEQVALDAGEKLDFLQLDYEFHHIICEAKPVEEAVRILNRLEAYLGRIRYLPIPNSDRPPQTIKEHKAIRDAIASGKPEKASDAMRNHIDAVERHFQEFVIARQDLFEDE